ncbi:MAG: M1 family metallopeptidase [Longimicrobiaceae bacterium]
MRPQATSKIAAALAALALALPAVAAAQARADTSVFRPLELAAPNEYRTASGAPGPRYWQQRADHSIAAALDTAAHVVRGTESIRYRNNSPETLRFVWLQVDQNLYRPGSKGSFQNPSDSRWGARDFAGGVTFSYVRAGGRTVQPHVDDTMMRLDLPRPLAPGESVELELGWSFPVPEHGSDRMGRRGQLYEIAQWFPRMAVFDDVGGWNTDPYLGQGEFYREYGDYDVAITVPAGFVVAATGVLQNPGEVLTAAQRERLARAAGTDEQVSIITAEEAGTAASRPRSAGTQTWRFRAENVHDFAWAASPRFRWDSETWDGVRCHSFYEPDAENWTTAADMTCFSIKEFSTRWFRYPYPQATSVAGPVGGMEYPMFVMVGSTGTEQSVFSTIAHEQGHEWFPMIVSSNERRYAWMDEGFNTFIDNWTGALRYPADTVQYTRPQVRGAYESLRDRGGDPVVMTPPDRILRTSLGVGAYYKPALALHMLRDEVVGPQAFDAAFREYVRRWAYKHPTPADFFRTMHDVTGRDLSWFWRGWLYTAEPLDQAVTNVTSTAVAAEQGGGFNATVELASLTPVPMPVRLRLVLGNGETRDVELPESIWYGGMAYSYVTRVPAAVTGVLIDPANTLPDRSRSNNAWGTSRTR